MVETHLVEKFVELILNQHEFEALDDVLDQRYRDYDPIEIPGYPVRPVQDREYIRALCSFLSSPWLDLHFTIEDVFGEPGRIAYQLFGEGMIEVAVAPGPGGDLKKTFDDESSRMSTRVRPLLSTSAAQHEYLSSTGKLMNGQLHVEYRSVGIFRTSNRRLLERRGRVLLT